MSESLSNTHTSENILVPRSEATQIADSQSGGQDQQVPTSTPETKVETLKNDDSPPPQSIESEVGKWVKKIHAAKKHHKGEIDRMKKNMEFVYGLQHPGQEDLSDSRYVANLVMREINQGVSSLYARNPKAVAKRRERMDYTVWDGSPENVTVAATHMAQASMAGVADPMSMMIAADFIKVEDERKMVDRVGKTLELEYQLQLDRLEPDFKLQMKQLVRRVKVCGVGFVRAAFKREGRELLLPSQSNVDAPTRAKRVSLLVEEFDKQKFDENSAKMQELQMLLNSLQYSMANPTEVKDTYEKLVFDFPAATSIIVDPACRIMKGFVGAKWIAVEYVLPFETVKAEFSKHDMKLGVTDGDVKTYSLSGEANIANQPNSDGGSGQGITEQFVCVWEVFNKLDRSRFFVCDGYHDYLLPPEEPRPMIQRFWPVIPITFNDVETVAGIDATIYSPSDVDLMWHPQSQWNKTMQMLAEHRRRNRPATASAKGSLSDDDKELLKSDYPVGSNIEVQGLAPGQKISDVIQALPACPITMELYSTTAYEHDIQLVTGSQQAVLGPITKKGTATEATISEQSRISTLGSNVDDIDELLSEMAKVGGEMMLREMSQQTVKDDVGDGATWPMVDRDKYLAHIYLEVAAASTGRPNKGVEIANFERLAPMFMQLLPFLPPEAGGQMITFLIKEAVQRLDDRIDVSAALPLLNNLKTMMMQSQPQQNGPGPSGPPGKSSPGAGSAGPAPVPNENQSGGPSVPLPARSDAASAGMKHGIPQPQMQSRSN